MLRCRSNIVGMLGAVLGLAAAHVPAEVSAPASSGMSVKSCVVYSTKFTDKTHDCSLEAAKACDGKRSCDIQIGFNLTAGKDIEPGSGFLGKLVKITYICDGITRQRGPYQQSDHATLLLECDGPK